LERIIVTLREAGHGWRKAKLENAKTAGSENDVEDAHWGKEKHGQSDGQELGENS